MPKINKKDQSLWLNKLKLNSWEVEILIVGFVLVMLLQIPEELSFKIEMLVLSASLSNLSTAFIWVAKLIIMLIITLCVKLLITSFAIYLGLRGFWVGLLGLSSVYPEGIDVKKLKFNKIFSKQLATYDFNQFITRIDNICSSIFSFSFLVSFSAISLCLFFVQGILLALGEVSIITKFPESKVLDTLLEVLLSWPHIIFGFLYFIDYFSLGILKRIKWHPFAYVFNLIDKFFKYTTLVFIYDTVYYAFISNVKKRILFLSVFGLTACTFMFTLFIPGDENEYFPHNNLISNLYMKSDYYENKFTDLYDKNGRVYPDYPFINSDIITGDYIKFYIPYLAEQNVSYKKLCPEINAINYETAAKDQQQQIIECLNQGYAISIDDNAIDSDFIFYKYSHEGVNINTFFMVIPVKKIPNGLHELKLSRNFDLETEIGVEGQLIQLNVANSGEKYTIIPFYLFKN